VVRTCRRFRETLPRCTETLLHSWTLFKIDFRSGCTTQIYNRHYILLGAWRILRLPAGRPTPSRHTKWVANAWCDRLIPIYLHIPLRCIWLQCAYRSNSRGRQLAAKTGLASLSQLLLVYRKIEVLRRSCTSKVAVFRYLLGVGRPAGSRGIRQVLGAHSSVQDRRGCGVSSVGNGVVSVSTSRRVYTTRFARPLF
jgi:hypothetical protein